MKSTMPMMATAAPATYRRRRRSHPRLGRGGGSCVMTRLGSILAVAGAGIGGVYAGGDGGGAGGGSRTADAAAPPANPVMVLRPTLAAPSRGPASSIPRSKAGTDPYTCSPFDRASCCRRESSVKMAVRRPDWWLNCASSRTFSGVWRARLDAGTTSPTSRSGDDRTRSMRSTISSSAFAMTTVGIRRLYLHRLQNAAHEPPEGLVRVIFQRHGVARKPHRGHVLTPDQQSGRVIHA